MAESLPYMQAYGHISKILDQIKKAQTPERFTNDFLATKLLVKASTARPFIPFAKRLGLLNQDGTPSGLYSAFRSTDPNTSGAAIATAMRQGYRPLFETNEQAEALDAKALHGLILQVTGLADGPMVKNIEASFAALKRYADFGATPDAPSQRGEPEEPVVAPGDSQVMSPTFGLAYQINLVLPKTDDIAVFNAIFRSLRENLLRQ